MEIIINDENIEIRDVLHLVFLLRKYPSYRKELIRQFLKDFENCYDLEHIAEECPEYKEELIQVVLKDREVIANVMEECSLLYIINLFPEHEEELIQLALTDSEMFMHTIDCALTLALFAEELPKHREKFIQPVLNCPEIFMYVIELKRIQILELK